jgi:putative methyltransferase
VHLLKSGFGRVKPKPDAAAKLAGAVSPRLADFLATDPLDDEWQDVRGMLLDPSCSGSGIVGRMEVADSELSAAVVRSRLSLSIS